MGRIVYYSRLRAAVIAAATALSATALAPTVSSFLPPGGRTTRAASISARDITAAPPRRLPPRPSFRRTGSASAVPGGDKAFPPSAPDWSGLIDGGTYLITCPNADGDGARLAGARSVLERAGLWESTSVMDFSSDDGDRIRGCYDSHLAVLRRALRDMQRTGSARVLVVEDNLDYVGGDDVTALGRTIEALSDFAGADGGGGWDVIHLAYISYVPDLIVRAGAPGGSVVQLLCGPASALGTTAYVIGERGAGALVAADARSEGYAGVPIPDAMAALFPDTRYAAYPMPFHRAAAVPSLVNPRLDGLRRLLFRPAAFRAWERVLVGTGVSTSVLFPAVVAGLAAAACAATASAAGAAREYLETGSYGGNVAVPVASGLVSISLLVLLAVGASLAPPPPPADAVRMLDK